VLRLPMELKLRGGRTKALLKRVVAGLHPDDLVHRRKQAFPGPMSRWMFDESFGRIVREALRTSELARDGYLDAVAVAALVDEHFSGRRSDRGGLLWALFSLRLWYRRWILRDSVA